MADFKHLNAVFVVWFSKQFGDSHHRDDFAKKKDKTNCLIYGFNEFEAFIDKSIREKSPTRLWFLRTPNTKSHSDYKTFSNQVHSNYERFSYLNL